MPAPSQQIHEADTMLSSIIDKYLKKPSKGKQHHKKKEKEEEKAKGVMVSPACPQCCCSAPCLGLIDPCNSKNRAITNITTTRTSRHNFAKATTSTLFPNIQFTNHESLPSLSDAASSFSEAYPQYSETQQADRIRESEYYHLSNHVCLDYTGFSLFSHAQASSSSQSFFSISYRSASLKSQVQYGNGDTGLESAIRNRIMSFLNISEEVYSMVCTANRATAFKLVAETYPFHSNKRLLTVYDYESEAVSAMEDSAQKRGAKIMAANFSWPNLRIHSAKLKRILNKRRKKKRGLFVFPLQSRMTGARYPYLWMRLAQENGWHVVLDASALGPKDLDTLGLSLIQPDFIICNFFKVLGENPSGFASLFIKKSSVSVLETSAMARSIGIVSIIPARRLSQLTDDFSGTPSDIETTSSFSGPMSGLICNGSASKNNMVEDQPSSSKQMQIPKFELGETSETYGPVVKRDEEKMTESEIVELESNIFIQAQRTKANCGEAGNNVEIECVSLDHADSLGLLLISSRLRYITNWLVIALMKLRHPNSEDGHPLVRIYGPRIKFERGPAIAFNVFDWKGEKVEPALVQKLADRSNISLSCGFLHNLWFSDKYEEERDTVLERRIFEITGSSNKRKDSIDLGISVVNASLGFLTNFEDAYKLWSFVAKFLDADFVEKERWRYMALNQKMIEV